MESYSTAAVAKMVGISKSTLLSWLYGGKVTEPKRYKNGGQDVRLWSERDLARVRQYKSANYRKGRGRKKKT
jgi:hypothetical protein